MWKESEIATQVTNTQSYPSKTKSRCPEDTYSRVETNITAVTEIECCSERSVSFHERIVEGELESSLSGKLLGWHKESKSRANLWASMFWRLFCRLLSLTMCATDRGRSDLHFICLFVVKCTICCSGPLLSCLACLRQRHNHCALALFLLCRLWSLKKNKLQTRHSACFAVRSVQQWKANNSNYVRAKVWISVKIPRHILTCMVFVPGFTFASLSSGRQDAS